ncbi:hypothetical protein ISCGN_001164 [Ixodes scapularis]
MSQSGTGNELGAPRGQLTEPSRVLESSPVAESLSCQRNVLVDIKPPRPNSPDVSRGTAKWQRTRPDASSKPAAEGATWDRSRKRRCPANLGATRERNSARPTETLGAKKARGVRRGVDSSAATAVATSRPPLSASGRGPGSHAERSSDSLPRTLALAPRLADVGAKSDDEDGHSPFRVNRSCLFWGERVARR